MGSACFFERSPKRRVFVNSALRFTSQALPKRARIPTTRDTTHSTMACTDTVSDVNNKLYEAEDEAAPVITLEYGPYMN